jgi:hypothetical protein
MFLHHVERLLPYDFEIQSIVVHLCIFSSIVFVVPNTFEKAMHFLITYEYGRYGFWKRRRNEPAWRMEVEILASTSRRLNPKPSTLAVWLLAL